MLIDLKVNSKYTGIMDPIGPLAPGHEALHDKLLTTEVTRAQLLRLAMKGVPAGQAARVVRCSEATARAHYRDPEFRHAVLSRVEAAFEDIDAAYEEKHKSLHERIEEQALKSCVSLIDLVQNENLHPSLKVKIHQDFMNRAEESAQISKRAHDVKPEDLMRASKVAQEMDNVIPFKRKEA